MERWLEDELVLVVPAGHEWAERGDCAERALRSTKLLVENRGSGTREVLEQALKRAGAPIQQDRRSQWSWARRRRCWPVSRQGWASDSHRGSRSSGSVRSGTLATVKVKGLRVVREFSMVHARGPKTNGVARHFAAYLTAFAGSGDAASEAKQPIRRANRATKLLLGLRQWWAPRLDIGAS